MLAGCNQFASMDENVDLDERVEEALEEKADDSTEEKISEEGGWFSAPEEVATLGLWEDLLAYWMVLNSKQPFISTEEGNQEFYWDEYD